MLLTTREKEETFRFEWLLLILKPSAANPEWWRHSAFNSSVFLFYAASGRCKYRLYFFMSLLSSFYVLSISFSCAECSMCPVGVMYSAVNTRTVCDRSSHFTSLFIHSIIFCSSQEPANWVSEVWARPMSDKCSNMWLTGAAVLGGGGGSGVNRF